MSPAPAPPDAAPGGGTLDGGVPGGGRAAVTVTVMWEVVAAAGQFDDLFLGEPVRLHLSMKRGPVDAQ